MQFNKYTKSAQTNLKSEAMAIAYLADAITMEDMAGVIFFCSPDYDLVKLTYAININFPCVTIGCTTAGEIGEHYNTGGIVAISFSAAAFTLHTHLIKLSENINTEALQESYYLPSKYSDTLVGKSSVGFLLIDGLSLTEEKTVNLIHHKLPFLPIVGGSAGDDLNFGQTHIFHKDRFHTNSAVFTFIETNLDFQTFQLQHFQPSETELVVTEADPENRIVKEIDGEPAAPLFARMLNIPLEDLTPEVFSMNPLMLKIGNDWHVRSVQKCNPDGSLLFYCAIENGLPLTIGKGMGITKSLQNKANQLSEEFSNIELTLGCDCILRRIEILKKNKKKTVEDILNSINFVGFNTYGEQFNSIHVNQTLTGIVFGEKVSE